MLKYFVFSFTDMYWLVGHISILSVPNANICPNATKKTHSVKPIFPHNANPFMLGPRIVLDLPMVALDPQRKLIDTNMLNGTVSQKSCGPNASHNSTL